MNVAIIGCSGMGIIHAQMASNCGLKIVACGDARLETAEQLAAQYGADASTDSFALIQRADVDIVGIMTPTPFHTDYVVAAAKAGKHIMCEKPFGRTIEDCQRSIDAAREAGVRLFVAHVLRYFPEYETMKQRIDSGSLGKVGYAKLYRGGIFPMGGKGWFGNYDMSGGVTLDSMIHDIDWLRYVFGEPEQVFCQAIQRSEPEKLDYSMATFRMKNGVIGKVIGTWAHPQGFRVEAEVCGEKGMIQYNSDETALSVMKRTRPGQEPGVLVPLMPCEVSPYELEWRDFLTWIEGKSQVRVTPEDGLMAVKMALAALESAQKKVPVKIR